MAEPSRPRWKLVLQVAAAGLGVAVMLALFWPILGATLLGNTDFLPLYVAAQRVPTANLYDVEPYLAFARDRFGGLHRSLVFTRLPFFALLLKPLGWLPYGAANAAWLGLRIVAVAAFVWLWPKGGRLFALMATCWSFALFGGIVNGQDATFLPLILLLAWRWRKSRPLLAGLVLSLCAIKFNRFLALPLLFLCPEGRPLLRGFALGAGIEVALSFVAAGWSWPRDYYALLTDASVMQVYEQAESSEMANLHGMLATLGVERILEPVLAAMVFAVSALAVRRMRFEPALALIVVAGVLISHHAFIADWTIVLFACVLVWRWLPDGLTAQVLGVALLAPPLAMMQLMDPPWCLAPPVLLLGFWVLMVGERWRRKAAWVESG